MSEFEPGFSKAPKDERDELAQKKAEYERALFDKEQKEAFGKFDVTAPNEGEDTYQSYLDKRPGEGIVRNTGDIPVDAQTNKFVSQEAYEAQKTTTQEYYDKLGGIAAEQSEFVPPSYESMGLLQLAKEASKARQLGDPAEEATIRAALENHLAGDALKDDTETPEQAQARYDADLARYDELVNRLSERGEAEPAHSGKTHEPSDGEGHPSARTETQAEPTEPQAAPNEDVAGVEAEATTDVSDEAGAATEVASDAVETNEEPQVSEPAEGNEATTSLEPETAAEADEKEEKPTLPKGGSYNGKSITVARPIPHPSGDSSLDAAEVVDEDGNVFTIRVSEIVYSGAPQETAQEKTPGTDVELYNPEGREVVHVETEAEEEKKGIKKWWSKAKDGYLKAAGAVFWASEWAKGKYSQWLEHGIDDSMNPEDQEKKRKKNRNIAIAAGAGLAVIGLGTAIALGVNHSLNEAAPDASAATGGAGSWQEREAAHQAFLDQMNADNGTNNAENFNLPLEGEPGVEEIVDAAPNPGDYTIFSGDGGEAVFQRLGIDPAKWYDVAPALLTEAPGDFYQDGNDIRFSHTGQLSQRAQEIINSLR